MAKLTRRESMVLRFIYDKIKETPIISVKQVAEFLGIAAPTAFEILNKLVEPKGLLIRIERKGYILSEKGKDLARKLVVVHRVLEMVFYDIFGMDPDCACEIASYIDFIIGINYAMNAMKTMGYPALCPHNKEIPIGEEN